MVAPPGKPRGIALFIVNAALLGALALVLALDTFGPAEGMPAGLVLLLLLGLVVVIIMMLVRTWKMHAEVYRAFGLEREERKRGTLWFVLGIVLRGPFMLAYDWIWASNVQHVRSRLGLPRGIGPGAFVGFLLVGDVGTLLASVWIRVLVAPYGETDVIPVDVIDQLRLALVLLYVSLGLGGILSAVAYVRLQTDTNAIWARFQRQPYGTAPGAWPPQGFTSPPLTAPAPPASPPGPRPAPAASSASPRTPPAPLAGGARRLLCPRCKTAVTVPPGAKPVCASCGFGST